MVILILTAIKRRAAQRMRVRRILVVHRTRVRRRVATLRRRAPLVRQQIRLRRLRIQPQLLARVQ